MPQLGIARHAGVVRDLTGQWLKVIADDPVVRASDGDFACSPLGLWLSLAVLSAGARAETARELAGLVGSAGAEAAAEATEASRLAARTGGLAVATALWARTPVYREFRELLPDVGFGHLTPKAPKAPDARDAPDTPGALDAWVRQATQGLVGQLSEPPGEEALLLLVNALALQAHWSTPFEYRHTADRPFTDAQGRTHRVPTMFRRLPRPTHAWTVPGPDGTRVDVVAMRCEARGDRTPAQVSLVLGEPGPTSTQVLPAAWAPHDLRRPVEADEVTVALPRLRLRSRLDLARHLVPLGAGRAASAEADFSGLSPEPQLVGGITQETVLKVHEQGMEAATVTSSTTHTVSAAVKVPRVRHIAFDRPFGLVVFAGDSGMPLFTAWQSSAPRDV